MNAPLGAFRLIELAAAHLQRDLDPLIASVDGALLPVSQSGAALPTASRRLILRLRLLLASVTLPQASQGLARLANLGGGLQDAIILDIAGMPKDALLPPPLFRLLANIMLLAEEGLPNGGTVRLAGAQGELFVQIEAAQAAWPRGTALYLVNAEEARRCLAVEPMSRPALTAVVAQESGIRLSAVYPPNPSAAPAILRVQAS